MSALRPTLLVVLAVLVLTCTGSARAHEVRPAYFEARETGSGEYLFSWKQPLVGDRMLRLRPRLSSGWLDRTPDTIEAGATYVVSTWRVTDPRPLWGQVLTVSGLDATATDVLVSLSSAQGGAAQVTLRPESPSVVLNADLRPGLAVPRYLILGVSHILEGVDHLCFVLGLVLLVGFRRRLVGAVSAFTVAHSLTLAATALGLVHVDPPVIELLVALSILFVAVEVVRSVRGEDSLTLRRPWLIAFSFGLLHGFAFAGVLADVGLPRNDALAALLLFNVGVELGQLIFIAVVAALAWAWRAVVARRPGLDRPRLQFAPGYLIGSLAGMWFIDRAIAVIS